MAIDSQPSDGEKPVLSLVAAANGESAGRGKTQVRYKEFWPDIEATKVVDWGDDYIVFLDANDELDWETSSKFDKALSEAKNNLVTHHAIVTDAAVLEAKNNEVLDRAAKEWFTYLIGRALVSSFERDYAGAQKTLQAAAQYYRARSEETSRSWYLQGSFASAIPFVAMGAMIWLGRDWFLVKLGPTAFWMAVWLMAGALGALLSVIARSSKLEFDSSAGWQLHYVEAASRIVLGALSGMLVGLALKSGIILDSLTKSSLTLNSVMMLGAFVGGASERLLGSIISKFDQPVTPQTKAAAPAKPH